MSVLVFDRADTYSETGSATRPDSSYVLLDDRPSDVLVIDTPGEARQATATGGETFLLFDAEPPATQTVTLPQDFLLIDAPSAPAWVVMDDGSADVLVVTSGGPAGPQGPAGPAGTGVDFQFVAASTVWVCDHPFGRKPLDVMTVDPYGQEIVGDVYFITDSRVEIHWFYPTAGTARVSA